MIDAAKIVGARRAQLARLQSVRQEHRQKRNSLWDVRNNGGDQAVRAFSKSKIEIRLKHDFMAIRGWSVEIGDGRGKVRVKYTGRDVAFLVSPKFMLDALSGMKGEVALRVQDKKIWLVCGNREAMIMTMKNE